eukprot:scaffold225259_cov19-Tisochrysis_lutea.AAC.1
MSGWGHMLPETHQTHTSFPLTLRDTQHFPQDFNEVIVPCIPGALSIQLLLKKQDRRQAGGVPSRQTAARQAEDGRQPRPHTLPRGCPCASN